MTIPPKSAGLQSKDRINCFYEYEEDWKGEVES